MAEREYVSINHATVADLLDDTTFFVEDTVKRLSEALVRLRTFEVALKRAKGDLSVRLRDVAD